MPIKKGTQDIVALYKGTQKIAKVYKGTQQVYISEPPLPSNLTKVNWVQFGADAMSRSFNYSTISCNNAVIEIDLKCNYTNGFIFSSGDGNLHLTKYNGGYGIKWFGQTASVSYADNGRVKLVISQKGVWANGAKIYNGFAQSSSTSSGYISLQEMDTRIYSLKMKEGNNDVANLIPCFNTSTAIYGFYNVPYDEIVSFGYWYGDIPKSVSSNFKQLYYLDTITSSFSRVSQIVFSPNLRTNLTFDISFEVFGNTNNQLNLCGNNSYGIILHNGDIKGMFNGSLVSGDTLATSNRYIVSYLQTYFRVQNRTLGTSNTYNYGSFSPVPNYTFSVVFCSNNSTSMRFYYQRIAKVGSNAVAYIIPVKEISTNKVGWYDLISGKYQMYDDAFVVGGDEVPQYELN